MPPSDYWHTLDMTPPHDRSFLAYHPSFAGHVGAVRWSDKKASYTTANGHSIVPLRWMHLPEDPVNSDENLKAEVTAFRRENT